MNLTKLLAALAPIYGLHQSGLRPHLLGAGVIYNEKKLLQCLTTPAFVKLTRMIPS